MQTHPNQTGCDEGCRHILIEERSFAGWLHGPSFDVPTRLEETTPPLVEKQGLLARLCSLLQTSQCMLLPLLRLLEFVLAFSLPVSLLCIQAWLYKCTS